VTPLARALFAAAAIAVTLAAAASATESTIYPGVAIGKVKLGMTATQVKKALGRDYLLNTSKTVNGKRYVEYGWDYTRWTVTFVQQGRKLRVVQVGTSVRTQRTRQGIGPGSTWRSLVRAYPNGICAQNNHPPGGGAVEYLVQHPSGTQTIYWLPGPRDYGAVWHVVDVRVRTRWEVLPWFAPAGRAECRSDWRTADAPICGVRARRARPDRAVTYPRARLRCPV